MTGEINFYNDLLIVEALATDPMRKNAGVITDMVSKVKDYVGAHIDGDNKAKSLFDMLGPGAVSMTFKAMGLGWMGMLAGLAMSTFHISITDILGSIWSSLKSLIHNDQPVTSQQVDSVVQNAVQQHAGDESQARTAEQIFRDARVVKLAMMDYEKQILSLTKEAAPKGALSTRSGTVSVLARVLSVLFKVALASAGLMVAGDVVNKFLGRSSALGNSKPEQEAAPVARSSQTKFPAIPGAASETHSGAWAVSTDNNPNSISNMLIQFTKDSYSGLDGHESAITASPSFQKILSDIIWYNHASAGDKVVIIPKEFKSKKDIADYFIDDVAKSSQ